MKNSMSTQNSELIVYQNQIENISDQLCLAVKGEFNFTIKINSMNENVQKLCMLINFVIDAANRALTTVEEKNAKLTELDKLKSDFLANVSHELRTPLTLIMGPLESIIANISSIPKEYRDNLYRMQRNASKLYILVNDVLDFSKLEAGKYEVHNELFDLNELLNQFVDDAKGLAHERKISLEFTPSQDLGLTLLDRKMVEKIVLNLISNALKFTPEGGRVNVVLKKEDKQIKLIVRDSGIGIPASHIEKLFERFHQIDSSNTRAYEGTGLGLAIVNQFTLLMKGSINVESEVGKGTSFTITLPLHSISNDDQMDLVKAPLSSAKLIKNPLSLLKPEKFEEINTSAVDNIERKLPLILIVDDNDDMRSYLFSLLKNSYEIITAKNGKIALESIYQHHPQVVLSDVMMPVMDGYQLTKKIKSDPDIKHTPIILITAKSGKEAISSGLNIGADDYLCKPFSPEELFARTENALRSYKNYFDILVINNQLNIANEKLTHSYEELERTLQELKTTQLQLLQHSKLASIGQLAAGVAHEINNPIAFVTSNTEVVKDYLSILKELVAIADSGFKMITQEMGNPINEVKQRWQAFYQQKNIPNIFHEAGVLFTETIGGLERVTEIVQDLKTFTYSKEGEMVATDINECMNSTLKIIHNELKYKCVVHKQYGNLPLLECHPRQLNQVFMNVLMNACQAIKEKGEIFISTEMKNTEIVISISDSGEGISPEHFEKLFDPFFTTKPIGEGTGLGLSISYNIVRKHGGRIEVKSRVGEGTTFIIYLPTLREISTLVS